LAGQFRNNSSSVDGALNAGTVFVPLSQKNIRDFAVGGGLQSDAQNHQGSPTPAKNPESPKNGCQEKIIIGRGAALQYSCDSNFESENLVAACDKVSQSSSTERDSLPTGDSVGNPERLTVGESHGVSLDHVDCLCETVHDPPPFSTHSYRPSTKSMGDGRSSTSLTNRSTGMARVQGDCRVNMLRAGENPPPQLTAPVSDDSLIEIGRTGPLFRGPAFTVGPVQDPEPFIRQIMAMQVQSQNLQTEDYREWSGLHFRKNYADLHSIMGQIQNIFARGQFL